MSRARVVEYTYRCLKAREGCCTEGDRVLGKQYQLFLVIAITYIETRILTHDLPTWCVEMRECGKRSTVKSPSHPCAHP